MISIFLKRTVMVLAVLPVVAGPAALLLVPRTLEAQSLS
jgi:hypothetical protein